MFTRERSYVHGETYYIHGRWACEQGGRQERNSKKAKTGKIEKVEKDESRRRRKGEEKEKKREREIVTIRMAQRKMG